MIVGVTFIVSNKLTIYNSCFEKGKIRALFLIIVLDFYTFYFLLYTFGKLKIDFQVKRLQQINEERYDSTT